MEQKIIGKDLTTRLSCRAGDYLIWCGCKGLFASQKNQYDINDIWQLSDSNFVTITNRQVDLPSWFELHPLEVSGSLVYWMKKKLDSGFEAGEIIEGPNIWRVLAGDRLVWVGKKRSGLDFEIGVLSIFTFNENAVIIGEPFSESDGLPSFGGFDEAKQSMEDINLCRNGWEAMLKLGAPRIVSADNKWTIG
jgi:hypothetical protein